MLTCPNEASIEWKRTLKQAGGNREEALKLWNKSEYSENENLNFIDLEDNIEGEAETLEEESGDFNETLDKVKLYIGKKIEGLKKVKVENQEKAKNTLKRLEENMKALEGVESINLFINDAFNRSLRAKKEFAALMKKKDQMTDKEILDKLVSLNDFANNYSILDEISESDVYSFFSNETGTGKNFEDYTPQDKLSEAMVIRNEIKLNFVKQSIPLMAKTLLKYKSDTADARVNAQIEELQKKLDTVTANPNLASKAKEKLMTSLQAQIEQLQSYLLDEESLEQQLRLASKDESILDFWMNPLISSEDGALALFAKLIKSGFENARITTLNTRNEIVDEYEEFGKTNSQNKDNPAAFNEGIYEIIKIPKRDDEGNIIPGEFIERASFVQKYDVSSFRAKRDELYNSLGPKPVFAIENRPTVTEIKELREWKKKRNQWYRENTTPKSAEEIKNIKDLKNKELKSGIITDTEYEKWTDSVEFINRDGSITYSGELTQPADKYISDKWSNLYDSNDVPKNAKGKYHAFLLAKYLKAQEKLPDGQQPGFYLPSIRMTDIERGFRSGVKSFVKNRFKESFTVREDDTEFGIGNLSEEGAKILPVFYTQGMDANEVSLDLARSVIMFAGMADRYEAMNKLNSEISSFRQIINQRKTLETNSKGQPIIDSLAKKLGYQEYLRQNGETNSQKHVDAFIDMVIYGESKKAEQILGMSLSKITDTAMGFSAKTTLALDLLKGLANNLQGNIQLIVEANAGEFFNKKNYLTGKARYTKNIPAMLLDFGKNKPKSLYGQLVEYYDAIQGEFTDNLGRTVTGSMFTKLYHSNAIFFNQHMAEHEIQVSTMLSLMDATKVIDNATGEEITLLDAHEKYKLDLENNTDFTEKKRQDFQNTLHALNKRMQGVYNEFDKAVLQKYAMGRVVTLYRKYFVPAMKRRWKKNSMDHELGSPTEGFYQTFGRVLRRDLIAYKGNVIKMWSTLTPFEKAQVNRVIGEITIVLSAIALILALTALAGGDDDDDKLKENYAYSLLMYQAIRMRSETSQYINPIDVYRVIRSPSALTSSLERTIKFVNQMFPWNVTEAYERKAGIWEKGDNKAWAYFLKLMGFTGNNLNPDQAVQAFNSTFR